MKSTVLLLAAASVAGGLALASSVGRAHEGHDHGPQAQKSAVPQHAASQAPEAVKSVEYGRSLRAYLIPQVTLLNADARALRLSDVFAANAPVMLQFMHTACTAACNAMTEAFSRLPGTLGKDGARLRLVSISVDPMNDTPARLKAYAKQYGAGANWQFLTGAAQDLDAVRRAFDDGRGDAIVDKPVAFLRPAPGRAWVRIDGFVNAEDLAREVRDAGAK
jgi:protein SCO1/2